jgi:NitT/TauT family transport system substrate-binding protein
MSGHKRLSSSLRGLIRSALCATFAVAVLAPFGASAADRLTMRLEWSPYVMHMPFHLAAEKGWFKAADLDMQIEDGNGSGTVIQLVGSGQFDLGHAALPTLAVGASKGLPIIALSEYLQKSTLGIIYAGDKGIHTLKDLAGKKVIYTPASFESPFLEPFFERNGMKADSLTLIGVDASAKISSYVGGAGDAVVTSVPSDMPYAEKRPSSFLLFADYGMNLPTFGIIANKESLKTKGPAIKRFVSIISAAWAYILDGHEKEAAEAVMKQRPNAATSVDRLVEEFKRQEPYFPHDKTTLPGPESAASWATTIKEMETAKVIKSGTKPEDYFTNDYIDPSYGLKVTTAQK